MIELTKTRRITIAVVSVLAVILLGFLFLNPPKYAFKKPLDESLVSMNEQTNRINPQTLAELLINQDPSVVLIDVRSPYEYAKGHIESAENISMESLLDDDNYKRFQDYKEGNKKVIFYGDTQDEASVPFMILQQMGFDNVAYSEACFGYFKGKDMSEVAKATFEAQDEKPITDFAQFIMDEREKAEKRAKQKASVKQTVVKKAAPVQIKVQPKTEPEEDEGC
jgi:rhodanese-related sulfurtransferase